MQKRKISSAKIKFGILVILILAVLAIYTVTTLKGYSLFEAIKEFVIANPRLSPVIFISVFIVSAVFPVPFFTIFGATIFGFWEVLVYSLIGNIMNAIMIFYLARWLGRGHIENFEEKSKVIKKLDMSFKKNAVKDMILLRFFYPIPVEIANLAGGLSGMKFKHYLWGTLIGLTPVLVASILIVKGKLADNNLIITIATIMLILLLVIPIIYLSGIRKFSKEKYDVSKKKAKDFVGLKK